MTPDIRRIFCPVCGAALSIYGWDSDGGYRRRPLTPSDAPERGTTVYCDCGAARYAARASTGYREMTNG